MELEQAIRPRRTHKAFRPEPVPRETLDQLPVLARWPRSHRLAGYWRTPAVLRTPEGRAAVGLPDGEHFVRLLHLGFGRQEKDAPERAPAGDYVAYLE